MLGFAGLSSPADSTSPAIIEEEQDAGGASTGRYVSICMHEPFRSAGGAARPLSWAEVFGSDAAGRPRPSGGEPDFYGEVGLMPPPPPEADRRPRRRIELTDGETPPVSDRNLDPMRRERGWIEKGVSALEGAESSALQARQDALARSLGGSSLWESPTEEEPAAARENSAPSLFGKPEEESKPYGLRRRGAEASGGKPRSESWSPFAETP
jgi:hypothetical protein